MSLTAKKFWNVWDKVGVLMILVALMVVFGIMDPKIVSPDQLITAVSRSAITGVAAAGMTFAICAGGFDLSVGSLVSLISCILAQQISGGANTAATILLALGVAAVCGIVNGLIITKLKVQTFVATLATQLAFAGIALVYSNGKAVQLTSKVNTDLKMLSTGKLFGVIPVQALIMVAVFVVAFLVYRYTSFGVKTRAIGSNEAAARTTGVKVDNTLILVFVVTAVTAALAAVLNTARLSTGDPVMGAGFELDAITAVILGGTSLAGGKGNIWGTLVGAVLVTFVKMGLNMMGISEAYQKLAIAIVLIFALTINGIKLIMQKEEK